MTDSNRKEADAGAPGVPDEPSVHEHGVHGYTDGAVGGFGDGYELQVAHGSAGDSPGAPSDSELDAREGPPAGSGALAQAVQKALARAHIDAADLRVDVVGSEVRLRGTVRHLSDKVELESRARAVPGVGSVVSEFSVLRANWQQNT
jgi:BON domain